MIPPVESQSTLIIPCAGLSSRYEGDIPKWMRTTPGGSPMVIDAMSGLPHHQRIVIAILREHEDRWGVMSGIVRAYQDRYGETLGRIDFAVLDEPTSSQSETVKEASRFPV